MPEAIDRAGHTASATIQNMSGRDIQLIGFKELQRAVRKSPEFVGDETKKYLVRGIAKYKKTIVSRPWRVGATSGGAPVSNDPRYPRGYQRQKSGTLRDSHITKFQRYSASIGPNPNGQARKYMDYVHNGTPRGQMKGRPWLQHTYDYNQHKLRSLESELLKNIVGLLAK